MLDRFKERKRTMAESKRKNAVRQTRREQAMRAQRRRRIIWIAAGVALLSVIVVGALISLTPKPVGEFVTVEPQEWPMADGKAMGAADAPVLVEEFADFQCPYCKQFHDTIQGRIVEDYVKTGQVRFVFRHFIVIDGNVGGNESRRAAEANDCANEQGRFWDYFNLLYANQGAEGAGTYADNRLKAFAGSLGLDQERFDQCFNSGRYAQQVRDDEAIGRGYRLRGTPSLIVNGQAVQNPMNYTQVQAAIDAALAASVP
jgi:protein-disulfide isomerase